MKRISSIAVLSICLFLSACGSGTFSHIEGKTGVSVAQESINIHVNPCSTGVDYIDIKGKNINGVENHYANFMADKPQQHPFDIDINAPEEPWRTISDAQLPQGEDDILLILAGSLIDGDQAVQTNVTIGEISTLQQGEILTTQGGKNIRVSQEEFDSCTASK